jgi:membrane-associated phospholipid phosphatase
VRVTSLPNHPVRAAARRTARKLVSTQPGRRAARRGVVMVLRSSTGRRFTGRLLKRYARGKLAGVRWPPLLYLPTAITFARMRRRLGPPPAVVSIGAAYGAPVAVYLALPRGRFRTYMVWLAHMWAYKVAFEVPYDRPEHLRQRLRVEEPIAIDRRLGGGMAPSERLQRRLRRPPELTLLDKLLTAVYLLWEAEPHVALGWLLSRHPGRFPGAALRLGLTYDLTLVGYFAVPTAPPWWASEIQGKMDGRVRRVTAEVMRGLQHEPRPGTPKDHKSDANPWAAWPSDHFASALSTAIALAEADPRMGAAGFGYAAALGFTLVYTGEHYVSDLILGAGLALGIHGAATLLTDWRVRLMEGLIQPGPRWKRLGRVAR